MNQPNNIADTNERYLSFNNALEKAIKSSLLDIATILPDADDAGTLNVHFIITKPAGIKLVKPHIDKIAAQYGFGVNYVNFNGEF